MVRLANVAGGAAGKRGQGDPVAVGQLRRQHLDQADRAAGDAGDHQADAEGAKRGDAEPGPGDAGTHRQHQQGGERACRPKRARATTAPPAKTEAPRAARTRIAIAASMASDPRRARPGVLRQPGTQHQQEAAPADERGRLVEEGRRGREVEGDQGRQRDGYRCQNAKNGGRGCGTLREGRRQGHRLRLWPLAPLRPRRSAPRDSSQNMVARLLRKVFLRRARVESAEADSTPARILHATLLLERGRSAEALETCERALQGEPDEPSLLNCRGYALHELRRRDEALASYDAALRVQPNHPAALANRATTLLALNRFDEALHSLARAEALAPGLADIHYVRGNVLQEMARHEKALRSYAKALALRPDFPEARMNEGISQLSLGRLDAGWRGYEARWACAAWTNSQNAYATRAFASPRWAWPGTRRRQDGAPPCRAGTGRHDPVLPLRNRARGPRRDRRSRSAASANGTAVRPARREGGLRAGRKISSSRPPLSASQPAIRVWHAARIDSDPAPLPRRLGTAHRAPVAAWRSRLGGGTSRRRIGLAWSGNAWHRNDANRSISFSEIAALLDVDAEFYCLQTELRDAERDAALQHPRLSFFGEQLADFTDTAALIGNLDLVICVDTSIAHLAGALGAPTWLLVPANADFRWLVGREDSPSYASMRLVRQRRARHLVRRDCGGPA